MRKARDFRFHVPTRTELATVIKALIKGERTREDVADWASEYVVYDEPIYPDVTDEVVWEMLNTLGGADLISLDRPYLYEVQDFLKWLDELKQGGGINRKNQGTAKPDKS